MFSCWKLRQKCGFSQNHGFRLKSTVFLPKSVVFDWNLWCMTKIRGFRKVVRFWFRARHQVRSFIFQTNDQIAKLHQVSHTCVSWIWLVTSVQIGNTNDSSNLVRFFNSDAKIRQMVPFVHLYDIWYNLPNFGKFVKCDTLSNWISKKLPIMWFPITASG